MRTLFSQASEVSGEVKIYPKWAASDADPREHDPVLLTVTGREKCLYDANPLLEERRYQLSKIFSRRQNSLLFHTMSTDRLRSGLPARFPFFQRVLFSLFPSAAPV